MSFDALRRALREQGPEGALKGLPYAEYLGLTYQETGDGLVLTMPFADSLVGAPGRLHGGTIAGLLEIAAIATLLHAIDDPPILKPVNVTVDYLRGGMAQDTFAAATITRLGKRIANLRVESWQTARDKPIATAHMNVLLER